MLVYGRPFVRALGLTAAIAGAVGAQGAPKACEVNESRPTALGRASLAVMTASSSPTPDAQKKQLVTAMKQIQAVPPNTDNPAGKGFVFGKALVLWSAQPNVGLDTKRGVIGLPGNPDEAVDLAKLIDSSFKVLETAMPECESETMKWRSQKGFVDLVNKAIERLNADDVEAAGAAAERAILINPFAPYGYVILGNVRQRQDKFGEAFQMFRESVKRAGKDTSYDDMKRQSLIYLGTMAVDSAEALASDANARKKYVDEAKTAFEAILADKGAAESAGNARQGLCRVAIATGDTAYLRTTYKEPLSTPASFSYNDLMNAGVCLARAEMSPEATSLFQGALDKNSFHRDVLSNLSIVLLRQDQFDRALPLTSRLVSVEPNNPDNLQLLVEVYAGIAKRSRAALQASNAAAAPATKAPATKAAPGTKAPPATKAPAPAGARLSAAASDSLAKVIKWSTDSAVIAFARKDSLVARVTLQEFNPGKDKAALAGSMSLASNRKVAEGEYTVKVDFLDTKGGVVATKDAKVAMVAGKTGRFRVEGAGANIAAFRYSIVSP